MSNISQWFVKAPIAGPLLFLFPLLSKAALRGIYTAGIVRSFLNFPCLTLVSMPESITFHKGGFSEASPHSSSGPCTSGLFSFSLAHGNPSLSEPHSGLHLLQPAQQVGIEGGQCTVWEKETRDRIKVLKMGPGDSIPWVKSPAPRSHITFI